MWRVLTSEKCHLVDPLLVRDGEHFEVTAHQYAENPHLACMKPFAKLYRKPISMAADVSHTLPVDPYLMGKYFGDSCLGGLQIASSDQETLLTMHRVIA